MFISHRLRHYTSNKRARNNVRVENVFQGSYEMGIFPPLPILNRPTATPGPPTPTPSNTGPTPTPSNTGPTPTPSATQTPTPSVTPPSTPVTTSTPRPSPTPSSSRPAPTQTPRPTERPTPTPTLTTTSTPPPSNIISFIDLSVYNGLYDNSQMLPNGLRPRGFPRYIQNGGSRTGCLRTSQYSNPLSVKVIGRGMTPQTFLFYAGGGDVYSYDSDLGVAVVHAGLAKIGEVVTINVIPSTWCQTFKVITKNGITPRTPGGAGACTVHISRGL